MIKEVLVMKKKFIVLLCVILIYIQLPLNVYATTNKPPQHSREELYQDIFCSMLMPYIQNRISAYYSKFLTDIPTIDPWGINILSAERSNGYQTFVFVLKIEVKPYVGPGIGVGVDHLTIQVDGAGNVKVTKFEHIHDYELPKNYQYIIKKK